MRTTILALALLAATATSARAKTLQLGDAKKPAAEITIPDAWTIDNSDGAAEAFSPDKVDYVAAEILDVADIAEANEATKQFFVDEKIKVNMATRTSKSVTIAGLPVYETSWDATDEDGPTHVRVALVKVNPAKILLLTRWGPASGGDDHGAAVEAIAGSIKPTK